MLEGAAAHVHQQRRVEAVGDLLLGQPLLPRQRRRDEARSHRLLGRKPESEIRRYRQAAEEVGKPKLVTHAQSLAPTLGHEPALRRRTAAASVGSGPRLPLLHVAVG